MLHTVVNHLVNLEKEIGLVAEQLSADIFILVRVQNITVCDRSQYGFDEVLEPLVDEVLLLLLELSAPLLLAKVFFEVLFNLSAH